MPDPQSEISVSSDVVNQVIIAKLQKQNLDLVTDNAKLEVYVRMLQDQVRELQDGQTQS